MNIFAYICGCKRIQNKHLIMQRLILCISFIICHLSFSEAQTTGYKMSGPYEVVARDGEFRKSKAGSERDMWQA